MSTAPEPFQRAFEAAFADLGDWFKRYSERLEQQARWLDVPGEADYVVVRASADLPPGFLPESLDGKWFDRSQLPAEPEALEVGLSAVAVPTGRFETREHDGAVAEVWEVRP